MACDCDPNKALMMIDFYDGSEGTDAVLIVCECAAGVV